MARRDRHDGSFSLPQTHDTRIMGMIVRVNPKGFGFIQAASVQGDVFFHASALPEGTNWQAVREQQPVSFTTVSTEKGLRAEAVEFEY